MKRKILVLLFVLGVTFTLTGCLGKKNDNKAAKEFKEDYEEINDKEAKNGKKYRSITLSEYNKFVETTPEEIVKMIDNQETFYIYFGSRICPKCRSVLEKADEVSRLNDIEKIYYIDVWDDDGNEIFRDKYEIDENNQPVRTIEGTKEYNILLEKFNAFLRDYKITGAQGEEIDTGEKRIYAPNFVYIEKGKIKRLATGKSDLQKDFWGEFTEEILKDEEEIFNKFFTNSCDEDC